MDGIQPARDCAVHEHEICRSLKELMREEGVNEMRKLLRKTYRELNGQKGQSLVEYALILALVAVVAILVLRGVGKGVNNKLTSINANLQ